MPDLTLSLSSDRATARLALPGADKPLRLSAHDVDVMLFQLARLRADMRPARAPDDPTPTTLVHTAPNMRWVVGPEPKAGQCHLAMQHPGIGWVAITLDEPRVAQMQAAFAEAMAASGLKG